MTSVLCSTYVTSLERGEDQGWFGDDSVNEEDIHCPFFFVPSLLTGEHIFKSQDTSYKGKINLCGTVQKSVKSVKS